MVRDPSPDGAPEDGVASGRGPFAVAGGPVEALDKAALALGVLREAVVEAALRQLPGRRHEHCPGSPLSQKGGRRQSRSNASRSERRSGRPCRSRRGAGSESSPPPGTPRQSRSPHAPCSRLQRTSNALERNRRRGGWTWILAGVPVEAGVAEAAAAREGAAAQAPPRRRRLALAHDLSRSPWPHHNRWKPGAHLNIGAGVEDVVGAPLGSLALQAEDAVGALEVAWDDDAAALRPAHAFIPAGDREEDGERTGDAQRR